MPDAPDKCREMHFAIRLLTPLPIRRRRRRQHQRAARTARGEQPPAVDDFTVRLTPDVRQYRHEDYFGTEVVEFEVTRPHRELVVDVRARVTTESQPEPSEGGLGGLSDPAYREAGGEFLLQTDDAPGNRCWPRCQRRSGAPPRPLAAVIARLPS